MKIEFHTEIEKPYSDSIFSAKTLKELREALEKYKPLVSDAIKALPKDDAEFDSFRIGLMQERAGKFAGNEWANRFGAIALPEILLSVSITANSVGVPWGAAYLRFKEIGRIIPEADGTEKLVR